ncbi:MAG: hypothetical protein L0241_11005 [Planctomycetia bacterium]|nr:hypothetical protein [Planctomycetia bacterium]
MTRLCAIVRLLMVATCLVPFTSARQAEGALAPVIPLAPSAPMSEAPAPVREEDENERETDGKERLQAAHTQRRAPVREQIATLPSTHASHRTRFSEVQVSPIVPVDHFCNGLGSPYRC